MCGIIGYTGKSNATGILLKGLKTLEYRGYDSAGIALNNNGKSKIIKYAGRVERLCGACKDMSAGCGIGHTRWATHGKVDDTNSHPHKFGRVTLVHNGIIENFRELAEEFDLNSSLVSQTDSEIAAGVIDSFFDGNPYSAIINAVTKFKGTYALAIMFDGIKDTIFAVRNVSPIVVCKNDDGSYLASDIIAVGEYCKCYFILDEKAIAVLTPSTVKCFDFNMNEKAVELTELDYQSLQTEKNGYPFYMEKEICEQPKVIEKALKSRIKNGLPDFSYDGIDDNFFSDITDIAFIACGTAMHAGLIAKELINYMAKIPCNVCLASEYMYSNPIINDSTLVICISQSGETIDTLEALRYAKKNGAKSLSVINVRSSSIARESDCVIYTDAGAEIAVASTKAYTTQLAVLYLISAKLSQIKGTMNEKEIKNFIEEAQKIPHSLNEVLKNKEQIHKLARTMLSAEHAFMIGRGLDYPALLEASLKLKEISYIHSEAFASGELKHGTIALITEKTPVIALITQSRLKSKEISNIKEVQSRGANVITLIKKSLNDGAVKCDFELPDLADELMTIPSVTAMQLFAYYASSDKGLDVDKPRNLAKVVTVE